MSQTSLILTLPVWMESFLNRFEFPLTTDEARMKLVIDIARENVKRKSGGPFAAAVFNTLTGDIISYGVNRVVPCNCSIAHAEMMALALAQQKLDTFNLGGPGIPDLELVTSTEPCAMCLGAIPWSGIHKIVCGATDADARAAGFDEGIKSGQWISELEKRGITVITELCRNDAASILSNYAETGGLIYNGGATV
jgi:tRNA(Arg) A34 adenosine deaminase TadA